MKAKKRKWNKEISRPNVVNDITANKIVANCVVFRKYKRSNVSNNTLKSSIRDFVFLYRFNIKFQKRLIQKLDYREEILA